ncbi:thermophilic glucose-6-phosphate isomerase-like enzyme [Aspergillus ellipticus CBS 707.79]|uniref:Thermophilic glucose-6-phosphate isomerase-like enzyme n=1 Tax=Aspergillus ellipticus CBS 707.79 TaxID=1448320 RepID=A0A319D4N7_9EURO|nr:thermophilic glucose-6-phosphate isomerase-like enzyme [Aspergillus ellipticus CBS 707.79]
MSAPVQDSSPYRASLLHTEPHFKSEFGTIQVVTADRLPNLKNLSIKRLKLAPGAIREPHWHANANELTYCLSGKLLISILDNGNEFSIFTISKGEMFFVESGSLHLIENAGDEEAELIVCFRHERPVDFSLSASLGAMSDSVLGNTFDQEASTWQQVARNTQNKQIIPRQGPVDLPRTVYLPNRHKFDVEGMTPPTSHSFGSARTAKSQFWPALPNMSMYSLRVEEDGMREPHWHPSTVEMGYVAEGYGRMSIMDPSGAVDTYTLQPGDVYYVPVSYPHQIEEIGGSQIHFLIFFDQPMPQDVGYRNAATLLGRDSLAATVGTAAQGLPAFPFTPKDPLIVKKRNPVDPVKSKL